jgi:hypothetical protein
MRPIALAFTLITLFLSACQSAPLTAMTDPSVWIIRSDPGPVTRLAPPNFQAAQIAFNLDVGIWDVIVTPDAWWASTGRVVYRINPQNQAIESSINLPDGYGLHLAWAADSLWIAVSPTSSLASRGDAPTTAAVWRVDPTTNAIVAAIPLTASHLAGITAEASGVWVSAMDVTPGAPDEPRLYRIDPTSHQVLATIPLAFFPLDLQAGFGAVWLTTDSNSAGSVLGSVDAATNAVATVALPGVSDRVAVGAGSVWVTDKYTGKVYRVDPAQRAITAEIVLPANSLDLAANDAMVWLTMYSGMGQSVGRLDPAKNEVVETIPSAQPWRVVMRAK